MQNRQGSSDLPGTGLDEEYDRRLAGFLRIGSDFSENYYQIEVPLKPTEYKKALPIGYPLKQYGNQIQFN